ncbi:MAG: hypothetical protein IJS09_07770 [Treponema sp.]|nr:hypothetical protein [Treponema sp.]
MYVKTQVATENQIVRLFEENGCRNVVSKSTQRLPVMSKFSPVQVQTSDSYLYKRDSFFRDEANTAMVFYVPEGQDIAVSHALHAINGLKDTVAGTDGTASFPWGAPIVCIVFAVICLAFVKNKLTFGAAAFFLVCFSFSRPLFTTSAAVCLAMFGFFMFQKVWGRRQFSSGITSPLFVLSLLVPVVLLFLSSPLSALFYTLSLLAAFSAILLVDILKSVLEERHGERSFKPVLIRSARFIPLVERKDITLIFLVILSMAAISALYFAGNAFHSVSVDVSQPALPAPGIGKSSLPDLDDFMNWSWNTVTFPYRRLTDASAEIPVDGDSVVVPVYEDVGGHIVQKSQTAVVFNNNFRTDVFDSVKELSYPALEKMMLKQGRDTRYSYTRGRAAAAEKLGAVLLILFMSIPAGIVLYFVFIKRGYGISF